MSTIQSIPNKNDLNDVFVSAEATIKYLLDNNGLTMPKNCIQCNSSLIIVNLSLGQLKCSNDLCKCKIISMFKGSHYESSRIDINLVLQIGYYWLQKVTQIEIIKSFKTLGVSSKKVPEWIHYTREAVVNDIITNQLGNTIGGNDIVVNIIEKMFVSRNDKEVWVIVGYEKRNTDKLFVIQLPERTANGLLDTADRYIKPGSIVCTESWKSFRNFDGLLDMNKSLSLHTSIYFVNPRTGVYKKTIQNGKEVTNRFRLKNRITITKLLCEEWRRKYSDCLWQRFIQACKSVEYYEN